MKRLLLLALFPLSVYGVGNGPYPISGGGGTSTATVTNILASIPFGIIYSTNNGLTAAWAPNIDTAINAINVNGSGYMTTGFGQFNATNNKTGQINWTGQGRFKTSITYWGATNLNSNQPYIQLTNNDGIAGIDVELPPTNTPAGWFLTQSNFSIIIGPPTVG